MSTIVGIPVDPKQLRPLLHAEIDRLPDDRLAAVHGLLEEMKVQRLVDQLDEATDHVWREGQITEDTIAETVRAYRQKPPHQ